jgi:hypothetical protein
MIIVFCAASICFRMPGLSMEITPFLKGFSPKVQARQLAQSWPITSLNKNDLVPF